MKNIYSVLQGPRLTEKAALLQEKDGKVIFKVHPKANKIEVKKAVELMFNVKVKDVKTAKIHGKKKKVKKCEIKGGFSPRNYAFLFFMGNI